MPVPKPRVESEMPERRCCSTIFLSCSVSVMPMLKSPSVASRMRLIPSGMKPVCAVL
ncbi:hypothetical protein FQZ97_1089040 [compost metagenome]